MGVFMLQKKREICYYKGEVRNYVFTKEIVDILYFLISTTGHAQTTYSLRPLNSLSFCCG